MRPTSRSIAAPLTQQPPKRMRFWLALALCAGLVASLPKASWAQADAPTPAAAVAEATQVQKAISQGKANWVASTTSMTVMSSAERMKRLGVALPSSKTTQSLTAAAAVSYPAALAGSTTLPAAFDWRNVNGNSFVTEVKNQGSCGSCWAFAATAVLESKALIAINTPNVNLNLSEQIVLSCSGAGSCNGGSIDGPANFLSKTGNATEVNFPYTGQNTACSAATSGWQNNAFKINNWQSVYNKYRGGNVKLTPEMIKNALYNSGPLVAAFNVYSDFYSYKSGIYSVTSTVMQGRHAVVIVGWDDAAQAFIVKNSWGSGWGENGYFRIAYNQLDGTGSKVEFGQEVVAYGSATPPTALCIYSLSQNSQTATASGMTGSFDVNLKSTTSCTWNAVSSANWIKITAGENGSGNGKVSFEVAANTGAQNRTGTITVGGQVFTITQAAAANPVPVCTVNASATSANAGSAVTISANCSPAASSYTWSNTGFASSVASGKVTVSKTTTYSVKGNNSAGSSEPASVTVAVSNSVPPPSCKLAASQTSIVAGSAITLTASCTPQAKSYSWTNSGFAATASSGKVTPTATTTYSVSGVNATGTGTAASVTVTVVTPPAPSCSLTSSAATIKAGASANLQVKCVPAATSYVWSNTGFSKTAASGSVKPSTTTTYSVSGVNASGTGEAARTTITVSNPAPLAPSQLSAPVGKITTNQPVFSWNASAGATSYKLSLSSKNVSISSVLTAASLGCANGTGVCSAKIAAPLTSKDAYNWSVVASNSVGSSPASGVKSFQVVTSTDGKTYPAGEYEAGPIWSNDHAAQICSTVCSSKNLRWNGNWTTTIPGKMSVCSCSK